MSVSPLPVRVEMGSAAPENLYGHGRPQRGLTLVELMVVIVAVLILAAIILSAVNRARGKGRQSACASNLHQIAEALLMYAEDHDGRGWYGASDFGYYDPATRAAGVVEVLAPYVKNREMWFCPSDPWAGQRVVSGGPWVPHWKMSYAITLNAITIVEDTENPMAFDAVTRGPHLWHFGGYNVAYGDGRVKWQKGDEHRRPPGPYPWP